MLKAGSRSAVRIPQLSAASSSETSPRGRTATAAQPEPLPLHTMPTRMGRGPRELRGQPAATSPRLQGVDSSG